MILPLLLLAALSPVAVPAGPYVLVNGVIGPGEWTPAVRIALDARTEIRAQQDARHLFLAVTARDTPHSGLDLYVSCRDGLRMLHVSAALGERVFHGDRWSGIEWGRTRWWTANPVCVVVTDGVQRVIAPEAFEFQLERSRLGREVAVYVHLKRPEKRLPAEASPDDPGRWVRLALGPD
jgi:hypothetical protein